MSTFFSFSISFFRFPMMFSNVICMMCFPSQNRTFVPIVFNNNFKINTFSGISYFRFSGKQEISPKSTKDVASHGSVFLFFYILFGSQIYYMPTLISVVWKLPPATEWFNETPTKAVVNIPNAKTKVNDIFLICNTPHY